MIIQSLLVKKLLMIDDMLDGWMIKQRDNARKKRHQNLDKQNQRLAGAGEVFVMAKDKQDLADIQSMNNSESKRTLQRTNVKQMEEQGSVAVENLHTTKTVLIPEQKQGLNVRKNF